MICLDDLNFTAVLVVGWNQLDYIYCRWWLNQPIWWNYESKWKSSLSNASASAQLVVKGLAVYPQDSPTLNIEGPPNHCKLPSLKLTFLPLKIDAWKMYFLLGPCLFSGAFAVSFRECMSFSLNQRRPQNPTNIPEPRYQAQHSFCRPHSWQPNA